jgi:hypothetical protein
VTSIAAISLPANTEQQSSSLTHRLPSLSSMCVKLVSNSVRAHFGLVELF